MRHSLLHLTAVATAIALLAGCASTPPRKDPAPASKTEAKAPPTQPAPAAAPSAGSAPAKEDKPVPVLPASASKEPAPFEGEGWRAIFDGTSLKGWRITDFGGHGEVNLEKGAVVLNMGSPFTGISYTNEFPKMNYEVAFDAMRVMGSDFFCGLTVPVEESHCSLIVGGWGGSLLGISSLNGMDASENETTRFVSFDTGKWYRIRMRVTEERIEVWIDNEKKIDVETTEKKISLRPGEIELSKPMGIAAWQTSSALREIKWRPVTGPDGKKRRRAE
jgi:hypothetical protein